MKTWQKVLLGVFSVLIIGGTVGAVYVNQKLDQVFVDSSEDEIDEDFDLNINESLPINDGKPLNIALFGLDCRTTDYEGCRSDAMMVLTYKPLENEVLVTSVTRDTYVDILEYGYDKINHAYSFGGPALAIQTLNRSFDLDIKDYVTVDFWAVEKIIDSIGGVEVEVDAEEILYINKYVKELNRKSVDESKSKQIKETGLQLLDGRQAVSYMRIRYTASGDFGRMERQREVMDLTLKKVKSINLAGLLKMVDEILPTIKTNLPKSEVVSMVTNIMLKGIPTMTQNQIPATDAGYGAKINGIYYYLPDTLVSNVEDLHELIYGPGSYTPTETVTEMNDYLENLLRYY